MSPWRKRVPLHVSVLEMFVAFLVLALLMLIAAYYVTSL
jgi:hypothetical protein